MKRAILLAIILILIPMSGFGHPGKTDFRGGHQCLKGCEAWGLFYKEYHLHDKDGNAIRVKRGRKQLSTGSTEGIASTIITTIVQTSQPVSESVATVSFIQDLREERTCSSEPLLYLLLLLLLLLLVLRMTRRKKT